MITRILFAYWGMSILGNIALIYIDWQYMLHVTARVARKSNSNPCFLIVGSVLILLITAPISMIHRLLQGPPDDLE